MAAVLNVGDIMPLAAHMPNIVLCRNMLLYAPSDKSSLRLRSIRRLARLSLERAAAVAFVSHTLADQVRTQFDVRRSEVIHHGPGLTLPFREPADGPAAPSCLVVASLYDYKRVEIAIDAVAELRRRSYGATLEVVGQPVEPRYLQELEQRVEQLALHRYVSFQGSRGPEGIARSYSKAAFALITSRTESFCHPILEAFSAGVPALIAEDLAVASEIAGDAALYCRPVGFAFADAAESLMRSPTTYARYANAGRIRAREFSWSTAADRTCALILECAKAR
jgi:glycosyltransferase involved in cell wall biosynthesis